MKRSKRWSVGRGVRRGRRAKLGKGAREDFSRGAAERYGRAGEEEHREGDGRKGEAPRKIKGELRERRRRESMRGAVKKKTG